MKINPTSIVPACLLLFAHPVLAHTGHGGSGFTGGFLHPVGGLDHVVAMVAVGLWGAQLGRPLLWSLPICFPLMMAVGAVLGIAGIPLPQIELLIALSGVVLGLAVAFSWKAPIAAAVLLVGLFAIFHGHAHGAELPEGSDPFAYALGFVLATGLLHLGGILIGALNAREPIGPILVRTGGVAIAVAGAFFVYSLYV